MNLSSENISSFQTLYLERFGKTLTEVEALEKATKLLTLMQLIYKPMTKLDFTRMLERKAAIAKPSAQKSRFDSSP